MAYTDSQKVDYLFKKLGYGVAKTDVFANKGPTGEGNASPLLSPGDTIWVSSDQIATVAQLPTSNSSVVTVYRDSLTTSVQCINAGAATTNATWYTGLTNWIPTSYGSGYQIKLYAGPSGSATPQNFTSLPPAGVNNDSWFFDYQSGIVNFGDTNVPAAVSGNVVYVVGARYTGPVGLTNSGPLISGTINTANVSVYSNSTVTSTNATYYPQLQDKASGNAAIYTASTLSFNPSSGNLTASNVAATQINGSLLGAVLTPAQTLITTVGNLTNLTVGGNITTVGNINTLGNVTTTTGVFWPNGNPYGSGTTYSNANVTSLLIGLTSNISTTANIYAGNVITTQANLTTIIATGNVTAGALVGTHYGNVNTTWVLGGNGNVNIQPGGLSVTNFVSNTAVSLPVGTTLQRPANVAGYTRFNTDLGTLEYYNGNLWVSVTNAITDQTFVGDGATQTFNLTNVSTGTGILVSINGVLQNPNTYTVNTAGTQVTFAEAPLITDSVDIRYLATSLNASTYGNTQAIALLSNNVSNIGTTGNLYVGGNLTVVGNIVTLNYETINNTEYANSIVATGNLTVSGNSALTGNATAPTANISVNNNQIATTAYVHNMLPTGIILMWSGSSATIPYGWYLCDGTNGTPNLVNRFIVGATSTYAVGATGGSADAVVVSHNHTASSSVTDPGHSHTKSWSTPNDFNRGSLGPGIVWLPDDQSYGYQNVSTDSATTGISVSTSVGTTGSSATNANLPPYYALCYIMKS
jgi:hypothetical protein